MRALPLLLLSILITQATFAAPGKPVVDTRPSDERLVLETNFGTMVFALYPNVAPKHVSQVLRLARLGVYDGINVYRVEKNFVAQVSNEFDRLSPLSETQRAAIQKIPGEVSSLLHERGVLSMARYDDPDSAEVSFSILLGPAPHLDGKFTIFGHLEQGDEALKQIENVSVDANNVPQSKVTVLKASVVLRRDVAHYLQEHATAMHDLSEARISSLVRSNVLGAAFLALITILAFSAVLIDEKHERMRTSLLHLMLLIGGVGILTLVTPLIQTHFQFLGAFIFFGLVAIFKVLGKFDSPK